jgi:hypothetical protein
VQFGGWIRAAFTPRRFFAGDRDDRGDRDGPLSRRNLPRCFFNVKVHFLYHIYRGKISFFAEFFNIFKGKSGEKHLFLGNFAEKYTLSAEI